VVADLRVYVDRMREQILELEAMQKAGRASSFDIDGARYELLEAETWLAQAGG
jgi:outer membrane protein TolC